MIRFALLLSSIFLVSISSANTPRPDGYQGLPATAYNQLDSKSINRSAKRLDLTLNERLSLNFEITENRVHHNGDVSLHGTASDADGQQNGWISATFGKNSVFGQIHHSGELFILTTDKQGQWAIEIPDHGISHNSCGTEHQGQVPSPAPTPTIQGKELSQVLDVLMIYNQAFADRYPGELLNTRINQYTQLANQVLANSEISLGVRIVGVEFFDYTNDNSNSALLNDMVSTLAGAPVQGLQGLAARRNATGADLVIMFRPHDIEVRGSCGIAFFPQGDPSFGVNVISDGMSSWSLCSDQVLIHEIGHNLGAGHQNGEGGGAFDVRGAALAVLGQFNTVMGSFGTGRADRFRELPTFSNPAIQCGGRACGSTTSGDLADNISVMREQMTIVGAYRNAVSSVPMPMALPRTEDDSDGDGVIDWDDAFPFDSTEQVDSDLDGTGDNADAFPNDPAETLNTDGDNSGNNNDLDDDNDGVIDFVDLFPLDANESRDSDQDRVGDNADVFPNDPSEQFDADADGIGDNADLDDDQDGFADLDPTLEDILVISVGNNRILRFDATTGASRGIEVLPEDGLVTFQSDLAFRASDNTVLYTSSSSVKRLNPLNRETLGIFVPAFDEPFQPQLSSGFPTGLATFLNGQNLATTLSGNNRVGLFRGQIEAFTENGFAWFLEAGEAPIDIVSDGNDTIILGQANRAIYRASANAGVSLISPPGTPWMRDPHRMTVSADGRLFISDQGRNSVVEIDPDSGAFITDFANLPEQGYSNPTGLAITRDGRLLVAASDQNAILSYNLQDGSFAGELVAPGIGGLNAPHAMIVVPQVLDRFSTNAARVIRPNGGLWFNPATNGRGFDIEVFNNRLTAIWYTFDDQGLPIWYLTAGDLVGFDYQAPLQQLRLNPDDSVTIEDIGTISLQFSSERNAEMNWTIGEASGSESLQWLEFDVEPASADFTGLWGRADGPGWGISLATQGDRTVAISFIYDQAGQPRWTISNPVTGTAPLSFQMNAVFSDTLCPTCSGVSEFTVEDAGTMTLVVPENGSWDSNIQFPQPITGSWILDQTPIVRFSEEPQRPR